MHGMKNLKYTPVTYVTGLVFHDWFDVPRSQTFDKFLWVIRGAPHSCSHPLCLWQPSLIFKEHRHQCGPTLGDGRVEQPLAKWRQYVEMNGHATCTFSEYCHFVRITAECCDVLLDPTQCFHLVLQAIISRRCVVSSAQESFGKLIRNYVEMLKGMYFYFYFIFKKKIVGHCVGWFLVKLPGLYKLLPFESRHFIPSTNIAKLQSDAEI